MSNNENSNVIKLVDVQELDDFQKSLFSEISSSNNSLNGILVFKDGETREVLRPIAKNKVVLRGRTFSLENLYKDMIPASSGYIRNLDRSINLFQVGSGGCPLNDPFNPIPVAPKDQFLKAPIPFRTFINDSTDSIVNPIDPLVYKGVITNSLGHNEYYYKRFENQNPVFYLDKDKNHIYKKLELVVSLDDCRNREINEVGLFFSTPNFEQVEMYSRCTFPTYAIRSTDTLLIEYYTYA